jgi:esterase/lipase
MKSVIILPGKDGMCNTDFTSLIESIASKSVSTVDCFGFGKIKNEGETYTPSSNLSVEAALLEKKLNQLKDSGVTEVVIIGKSMGGALALNPKIGNHSLVSKVIVLGLPAYLGYPLDFDIKITESSADNTKVALQYLKPLSLLSSNKVFIIQGGSDKLCSVEDINNLYEHTDSISEVQIIDEATHGFKSSVEGVITESIRNQLSKIITKNLEGK